MNIVSKLFAKMLRRKFVYASFSSLRNNHPFLHEGTKYTKLDKTRAITTCWPTLLRDFDPKSIVLAIYY